MIEMKRRTENILCFIFICMLCIFIIKMPVQAANLKTVSLKKGKTFSYDLNGDKKKEKIKVTYIKPKVNLYINGKLIYSKKVFGESDCPVKIHLVDFNTSDKYREILIQKFDSSQTTSDFFCITLYQEKEG